MKAAFFPLFFLGILSSFAQENIFKGQSYPHPVTGVLRCATDEMEASHWDEDTQYSENFHAAQRLLSQYDPSSSRMPLSDSVYRIPVVVHVIHNGGASNISDQKVLSQIRIMNEDFRKIAGTNGDGSGVDTRIEFFMAERDDQGNCTNGIVRIQSSLSNHNRNTQQDQLKALSQWDPTRYLNMWVVNSINGGGVLGYAAFPWNLSSNPNRDGVVIAYNFWGDVPPVSSPYNLGRTATHEVGHWLGLLHTFQGGCVGLTDATCFSNSAFPSGGDGVCDTPPVSTPNFGCATSRNSCNETTTATGGDVNDQVENYMDYSDDFCFDMFSAGQRDRMYVFLDNQRSVIHDSLNLVATGYYGCAGSMTASETELCNGDSLVLTFNVGGTPPFDLYYNDGMINYVVNGVQNNHTEVFYPSSDVTFTFDSANEVGGANIPIDQSVFVVVKPGATAGFFVSGSGLSYNFISQSTPGSTLTWDFGDGTVQSGGSLVSHTYTTAGVYVACITSVISNGCQDVFCDSIFAGISSLRGITEAEFQIYPNPARDVLNVSINPGKTGVFSVQLLNSKGKVELEQNLDFNNESSQAFNLEGLSKGFYIVRVLDSSGNQISRKIIIE